MKTLRITKASFRSWYS